MLTSFAIGFIFIGLTLLLLIFQIIKFKFMGQVCFSHLSRKYWEEHSAEMYQKNDPLNQKMWIWNINSNKVRPIKINPMAKEVNIC